MGLGNKRKLKISTNIPKFFLKIFLKFQMPYKLHSTTFRRPNDAPLAVPTTGSSFNFFWYTTNFFQIPGRRRKRHWGRREDIDWRQDAHYRSVCHLRLPSFFVLLRFCDATVLQKRLLTTLRNYNTKPHSIALFHPKCTFPHNHHTKKILREIKCAILSQPS